jgi:hypothetical protein
LRIGKNKKQPGEQQIERKAYQRKGDQINGNGFFFSWSGICASAGPAA